MTIQARLVQSDCMIDWLAAADYSAGDVIQLPDGRAGVVSGDVVSGDQIGVHVAGIFEFVKVTGVVFLSGDEVFWDHSANNATYKTANDRDFFVGSAAEDVASTVLVANVNLNVKPAYLTDLQTGAWTTLVVKTVVGSTTVEVPDVKMRGGSASLIFGATAEAQKVDLLSTKGFAPDSNWIVDGIFNVIDDGDAAAIDFNIGVANATHASDFDAITEFAALHLDANSLDLYVQSDDGTTDVALTDTTVNIVLSTPVHFKIDGRNPADLQIYVNSALVNGADTFTLAAATGPLFLIAHLEKTADDETARYNIDQLRVRLQE